MGKLTRTWLVEQQVDPETGRLLPHYDRDTLLALMGEVEPLLFMAGGMVSFATERVQVGELGDEPLAVSRRVIVTWTPYSPMVRPGRVSTTTGEEFPAPPAPGVGRDMSPEELEEAIAAQSDEVDEEEQADELEEEIDTDLTTTGPPRPDAEF